MLQQLLGDNQRTRTLREFCQLSMQKLPYPFIIITKMQV